MAESNAAADAVSIALPQPADTERLGRRLAACVRPGDVLALTGELGAGKTALARALLRAMPAPDGGDAAGEEVPSPTFTLVQTYDRRTGDGVPVSVWHFDLYRLAAPDEIDELGWEEALAGAVVLIEWPDRLGSRLPQERLDVTLAFDARQTGRIAVLQAGAAWAGRLDALAAPYGQEDPQDLADGDSTA